MSLVLRVVLLVPALLRLQGLEGSSIGNDAVSATAKSGGSGCAALSKALASYARERTIMLTHVDAV